MRFRFRCRPCHGAGMDGIGLNIAVGCAAPASGPCGDGPERRLCSQSSDHFGAGFGPGAVGGDEPPDPGRQRHLPGLEGPAGAVGRSVCADRVSFHCRWRSGSGWQSRRMVEVEFEGFNQGPCAVADDQYHHGPVRVSAKGLSRRLLARHRRSLAATFHEDRGGRHRRRRTTRTQRLPNPAGIKPTWPAAAGSSTRHPGYVRSPARTSCHGRRQDCIRHKARGGSVACRDLHR